MAAAEDIRETIRKEYIKCSQDPVHFMKKYCMIQHPTKGRINFNLYPFQEKVLFQFSKNNYNIVLKSRQLGISTLVAGYSLWMMLFNKDKNVLCIATKQETAKNMVTKVRFMYENLPMWLRGKEKPLENNKLLLKLRNGSQVKATSASGDAGRSEAVSLLIIDEAAFIEGIDTIFGSAQQTLATGGACVVLSTPNGTGNWFHQTWEKATNSENSFTAIRLSWKVHPERDQAWRDQQDADLGIRMAAQECDCDFSTSGDVVFEPEVIERYETNLMTPIQKRGEDNNLWIWDTPDYDKQYMVISDVARGDGQDYSACHVLDVDNMEQVAEYKGQIGTRDYGNFLVGLATEYNDALLVIENANVGWDVVQTVIARGYKNLYYSPRGSDSMSAEQWAYRFEDSDNSVPGFTNSLKTRPLIISKLREYASLGLVIIRSSRTLSEMKTFIWKNGKAQAQQGYNDDLIISLAIGVYLRETALRFKTAGLQMTKASINAFSSRIESINPIFNNNMNQNPCNIKTVHANQDLTWLL